MSNITLLMDCVEYIEAHLGDDIRTESVAKACTCSRSSLDKLFRYVYNMSVHNYVIRRRMMLAARLLSERRDMNILDIALECGYNSNEAFTRAFRSVWNNAPSKFCRERYAELFPRLKPPMNEGDEYIMTRKRFDITELYDLFKSRDGCWFVCTDIVQLVPINEISNKAGDLAILTALDRMNEAAGDDDIVFRIGGDEFCILTASTNEAYADCIAQKINQTNGKPIVYNGRAIPLSLYTVKTKLSLYTPKYDELFTSLHTALRDGK